jgi:hypothetical protein
VIHKTTYFLEERQKSQLLIDNSQIQKLDDDDNDDGEEGMNKQRSPIIIRPTQKTSTKLDEENLQNINIIKLQVSESDPPHNQKSIRTYNREHSR